jgi:hypothetical protein
MPASAATAQPVAPYALMTRWRFDAPIERIWQALQTPEAWPQWWRYVKAVSLVEPGDATGVGALRRFTWSSRLPYSLTFDMRTTRIEAPHAMEGAALGDLVGTGRWALRADGAVTDVTYDWQVATSKPWMNRLAPLLAPAFAWNHHAVMHEGGRGLAQYLGARLLAFEALDRRTRD